MQDLMTPVEGEERMIGGEKHANRRGMRQILKMEEGKGEKT